MLFDYSCSTLSITFHTCMSADDVPTPLSDGKRAGRQPPNYSAKDFHARRTGPFGEDLTIACGEPARRD